MINDTHTLLSGRFWFYVAAALCVTYLTLPILLVVPMSFSDNTVLQFPPQTWSLKWYRAYFESPEWRQATYVSVAAAVLTTVIATPLGTLAAWAIRKNRGKANQLFWIVLMSPLIIPGILIAVGIFLFFARAGLTNTMTGLVAAHVMHALPFVLITVSAGLRSFDLRHEMIARCLGGSPAYAFLTVVLPQIRLSVAAAAFLAFMSSLDEVVIASFISGGDMATLPKKMFSELRTSINPTIAAISTLLIAVSLVTFAASEILQHRAGRRGE